MGGGIGRGRGRLLWVLDRGLGGCLMLGRGVG
jgi:hypothetical protein